MIIGEALNARMSSKDLSVQQIAAVAARRGIRLAEVLAMPEKEEYVYSNGPNYVCSTFVTAMWKVGGLFGDMEILPQEFAPKDVYMLKIFNPSPQLPEICKYTDPSISYCQIMGEYLIELPVLFNFRPVKNTKKMTVCIFIRMME